MVEAATASQLGYIIVPGKNWRLSLAELLSFFEARKLNLQMSRISRSFFAATGTYPIYSMIDDLGGVIKIGEILAKAPLKLNKSLSRATETETLAIIKEILSESCRLNMIRQVNHGKHVFGVSLYSANAWSPRLAKKIHRLVGSHFKTELNTQGVKAKFMGFPKSRTLPQLTHVEVIKRNLVKESMEVLFCIDNEQVFIARTKSVHNPFEFQKRDIGRPIQRKIFSIPPRLAKILVNLSACIPGSKLLDPFCGIGTILQEALLIQAKVIGIDKDPWCVQASRSNLEWLATEYNLKEADSRVLTGDARRLALHVSENAVDCIATEPYLGPPLRFFPTERYARTLCAKLEPMFKEFLEEAHKVLKPRGKAVLVTPCIRTRSAAFVRLNLKETAGAIGFDDTLLFPKKGFAPDSPITEDLAGITSLVDIAKRHRIGREIHVFEKRPD